MALVTNNILLEGLSGALGDYVYKVRNGKTFRYNKQRPYSSNTPAQQSGRNLFREASQYAFTALQNPELYAFYAALAGNGRTPRNMAIADYCKPPVIHLVDASGYMGNPGDRIQMLVTDNGKVQHVRVQISISNSVIEEGEASITPDGLHWVYIASKTNHNLADTIIEVCATDLAGRIRMECR